jgi:hypothetical protein
MGWIPMACHPELVLRNAVATPIRADGSVHSRRDADLPGHMMQWDFRMVVHDSYARYGTGLDYREIPV